MKVNFTNLAKLNLAVLKISAEYFNGQLGMVKRKNRKKMRRTET
jgi:hypothetical protein